MFRAYAKEPLLSKPHAILTPQLCDVAKRRRTEEPAIFAAELRGAVIPDANRYRPDISAVLEEQPACLVQPQLLLILERTQRRDVLEVMMERRHAHVHRLRQRLHPQELGVVRLDPLDRPRDAVGLAPV